MALCDVSTTVPGLHFHIKEHKAFRNTLLWRFVIFYPNHTVCKLLCTTDSPLMLTQATNNMHNVDYAQFQNQNLAGSDGGPRSQKLSLDKSKNSEREKERNKKGTSLPNSNLYSELQKRIILPLIQIGQFQIFLLYARQDGTLLN